ncbi:LolA family protein [Halomonas sp. GXIMD04776]|uniref:LolA family protein n=1 Tax=Halomonas sp. GXIMD04776 TaxID=3415605 RepID=UPI003CB2546B
MRSLASGLLLLFSLQVHAFSLDEWRSWQSATPAFQSRMEQSRWLHEAEIRVHATGQLLFTPYRSLIWQWLTPEPRLVEFDKTGPLLNLKPSEDGTATAPPLEESDDNLPGEQLTAMLLLQALSGNLAALEKKYHLLLEGDRNDWQLILLPRERNDEVPKKITLEGGRFIQALRATSSNGNELTLELAEHQRLVNPKGAEQLATALRENASSTRDDDTDAEKENDA